MSADACPDLEVLEELALGRLDDVSSRAHSTHAAHCASCAARLAEVRANLELEAQVNRLLAPREHVSPARLSPSYPAIDGFEIVRELGRGGMGVVYEARQLSPARSVALKVVRGSQYVDATTLRLFQREIRVLARLEHPSIARLFDAGCTDAGEHWFAMELVRGETLSKAAERLTRAEKLALFLDVCAAIDFAHQRGVVHRDLKPSNLLVEAATSGGVRRVRVLDFGLAKITEGDVAQSSLATEVGAIRGTLAYMSPEQSRGDPSSIDLRADVYALGVVLYELLTGRLPYDVGGLHLAEAARRIQESAPQRPSSIDASLRGELETIALKALEKDPARRYSSASALAEDVRRHLAHEPILARAPSGLYQLKKLVERHKLASALAATTFGLAIGTAVWTTMLYTRESQLRADSERNARAADAARRDEAQARAAADARGREALAAAEHAEAAAERARKETRTQERITEFLVDLYSTADPDRSAKGDMSAREMLDRSAKTLETLADEPEVRAALEIAVAQVYGSMGLHDRARPRYERAIALRRSLPTPDPVRLGEALNHLGFLEMSVGNLDAARRAHEEADCLCTGDVAREGDGCRVSAASRTFLANLRKLQGDLAGAERLAREAVEILARGGDQDSETTIGSKQALSMILYQQRRDAEAEALAAEVVEIRRRQDGASLRLAIALSNLGLAKLSRGNVKEGEPLVRECFEIRRELLGEDNPALAGAHSNLAWACDRADLRDESLAHYLRAIELCEREPGSQRALLATACKNLAKLHMRCQRIDDARAACRKAIDIRERDGMTDQLSLADCYDVLGQIEVTGSRFDAAVEAARKAVELFESKLGPRQLRTSMARTNLGVALLQVDRLDESESALLAAFATLSEQKSVNPAAHASAARWLTKLYERKGDAEAAARYRDLSVAR